MASYGGEKQSLGLIYIIPSSVFSSLLLSRVFFHFDLPPLIWTSNPWPSLLLILSLSFPINPVLFLSTVDFDGDYVLRRRGADLNLALTNSLRIK